MSSSNYDSDCSTVHYSSQLGGYGGHGMNAVPKGKEANVAFEVYMPPFIATH